MTCEEIDLYGANNTPICIGFGDTTPLVLQLEDEAGNTVLTGTAALKLHIYKYNGVEVASLAGVVDMDEETVTFTFIAPFWSKLRASDEYDYKIIRTDGALVKTDMASKFRTY